MFWIKKQEITLEDMSKKIVLERVTLFGGRRRLKFIETAIPAPTSQLEDKVISVTRRRRAWRFRFTNPIRTYYYKKNSKGDWIEIGSVIP